MQKKDKAPKGFSLLARSIHWVTALAVVGLFGLGFWMVELDYYNEWYQTAPELHKSIGLGLFGLTLFRIIYVSLKPTPSIEGFRFERIVAKCTHLGLYVLLLTIFASGYMISTADGRGMEFFGLFEIPSAGEFIENQEDVAGAIHAYAAWALIGFAGLHALAALKHHFVNKDNTLKKMIGNIK
ncbi:cytochrome b [Neptuniibacter sp. QD37_11]|uniref:cytochrome b n=1 Tax=Neptuniibacter sp. QD37_11 TaxID=3398209 RepID=UPI0039F58ECF